MGLSESAARIVPMFLPAFIELSELSDTFNSDIPLATYSSTPGVNGLQQSARMSSGNCIFQDMYSGSIADSQVSRIVFGSILL